MIYFVGIPRIIADCLRQPMQQVGRSLHSVLLLLLLSLPVCRDRAKERREGLNIDFADAEQELAARGLGPTALKSLTIGAQHTRWHPDCAAAQPGTATAGSSVA
jgi:hypothetical protein